MTPENQRIIFRANSFSQLSVVLIMVGVLMPLIGAIMLVPTGTELYPFGRKAPSFRAGI